MFGIKNDHIDDAPPPDTSVETLVGQGTEIQGDIHFTGGLHVDGTVKGKIMADSDKSAVLSVSETGKVEGDVRVSHVVLNGTVEGDVYATKKITLSPKARVNGNVYYKLMEMNAGAMVNGQMLYQGEGADSVAKTSAVSGKPAVDAPKSSSSNTVEIKAAR